MKKFFAVLLVALLSFLAVACNWANETATGGVLASTLKMVNSENNIVKKDNYYEKVVSFYDDEYYYFVFDMGEINNVPLSTTYEKKYYSGYGTLVEQFSIQETTTQTLKLSVSQATSNVVETKNEDTWNVNGTANFKFGVLATRVSLTVSTGYNHVTSKGETKSESWNETYENCQEFSHTEETTRTITFDKSCPEGYYFYRYMGTVNLFVSVVIEKDSFKSDNPKVFIDTHSSLVSYGYYFGYSKDGKLDSNLTTEKFQFDLNILNDLEIPTEYISNEELGGTENDTSVNIPIEEKNQIEVIYEDFSVWPVEQIHTHQQKNLNIINLRELFGYSLAQLYELGFNKLQWDISIGIKEINQGYQEFYLGESIYVDKDNRKTEPLWGVEKYEFNGGKIGDCIYNAPPFIIDILKCKDILYFTYSANGNGADTWKRTSLVIKITAYK